MRASLERHKVKICELSKELEQETLYVEYLERLLSDVEKYRASGGDPTALFEAASGSGSGNGSNNGNSSSSSSATNGAAIATGTGSGGVDKEFVSTGLNI